MRPPVGSRRIQQLHRVGTALFVVTSVAAVFSTGILRTVAAIVALALFAIGTVAMLAAFLGGVDRSRTEEVSVASLFLLMGSVPAAVRREFHGLTLIQVVVGVVTAFMGAAEATTEQPFTSLAFGILVPMLGLGLAALWAAGFGTFPPRDQLDHKRPEHARPEPQQATPPAPTIESEELHNG